MFAGRPYLALVLAALVLGACGKNGFQMPFGEPTPIPFPSAIGGPGPAPSGPAGGGAGPGGIPPAPSAAARSQLGVVYFARLDLPPVAVRTEQRIVAALPEEAVRSRLAALKTAPPTGPFDSLNVWPKVKGTIQGVTVAGGLATIDFNVPRSDWGIDGPEILRFLQQAVYTATEEPGIDSIRLTQNHGEFVVIGKQAVALDRTESRGSVFAYDHEVVYFSRPDLPPVALRAPGAGATVADRITSRLTALARAPRATADGYATNYLAMSTARLVGVEVNGDVAYVQVTVPTDDWGLTPDAQVLLRQQLVFTVTEEPVIRHAVLRQNGGKPATLGASSDDKMWRMEDVWKKGG